MAVTDDIERLYNTETWLLEGHRQDARLLNMSAGGRAGRRRTPCASSLSADASCAPPPRRRAPRLTLDQLNAIRGLEALATASEIARRVAAASPRQVRDVVAGRTYRNAR
ncbi:hypothetical protein [Brevundimonas naejangsanensis]|uniref:hypothetical protein n=1 Tax=Brevundimonas naejangsanensis TaxID=588932 RepID=UPI003D009E97